ncbi:hypothetical protein [Pseudoduganella ginsengisoli]|uniref:Uncharacterized protein n=1 Tax=Pseudoduganella ginsengisoli TaxID=1462440 RepID=A0A6L6Q0C4_9BURK|nr:hypothetical protein [Pseudoduganella ginsengisoli]MTW03085.1 hypothetical protein [Pseudoduganella ginsengisoli]
MPALFGEVYIKKSWNARQGPCHSFQMAEMGRTIVLLGPGPNKKRRVDNPALFHSM